VPRDKTMNLGSRHIPDLQSAFIEALVHEGFEIVFSRGEGSANLFVEVMRPGLIIRVSVDRGQWWVECGPTRDDLFDPGIWKACFENRAVEL
jgi:hypothetical protein